MRVYLEVVTVQADPGGEKVGNVYRLGWKERCADDADDLCEVSFVLVVGQTLCHAAALVAIRGCPSYGFEQRDATKYCRSYNTPMSR